MLVLGGPHYSAAREMTAQNVANASCLRQKPCKQHGIVMPLLSQSRYEFDARASMILAST